MSPTLGLDTTLPQYRLDAFTGPQHRRNASPTPYQYQCPVPYVFYGILAIPETLREVLGVKCELVLSPVEVRRV